MIVLKEFRIDEHADTYLTIKGRQEGIISWVFSKIGIDPTVELTCNRREILYKSASVRKGQLNISIPNSAVTAVVTGFHKPFQALVLAAAFLITGLSGAGLIIPLIIGVLLSVACLAYYILNKAMIFGVYNGGDTCMAALAAKRSVIEGVSVDFNKFEKAAALLNKAILQSSAGETSRPRPAAAETPPPRRPAPQAPEGTPRPPRRPERPE